MKGNLENLNPEELEKKQFELKEELRELRFTLALSGSVPNPMRIRQARREIARIKTLQRQRELRAKGDS